VSLLIQEGGTVIDVAAQAHRVTRTGGAGGRPPQNNSLENSPMT